MPLILVGMDQKGIYAATQRPSPLLALSAVAVHQGRLSSCRYAEADPHGLTDHRNSPVAGQGG